MGERETGTSIPLSSARAHAAKDREEKRERGWWSCHLDVTPSISKPQRMAFFLAVPDIDPGRATDSGGDVEAGRLQTPCDKGGTH